MQQYESIIGEGFIEKLSGILGYEVKPLSGGHPIDENGKNKIVSARSFKLRMEPAQDAAGLSGKDAVTSISEAIRDGLAVDNYHLEYLMDIQQMATVVDFEPVMMLTVRGIFK